MANRIFQDTNRVYFSVLSTKMLKAMIKVAKLDDAAGLNELQIDVIETIIKARSVGVMLSPIHIKPMIPSKPKEVK